MRGGRGVKIKPRWTAWLDVALLCWLGLAVPGAGAIAVSLFGSLAWLSRIVPPCPAKLAGVECMFCGMTHAFLALGHGNVRDAIACNAGSPWLYTGLWLHLASSAVCLALPSGRQRVIEALGTDSHPQLWQRSPSCPR